MDLLSDGTGVPGLNERRLATLRVLVPDAGLSMTLPARVTLTAPASLEPAECTDAYVLAIRSEPSPAPALATVALPPCTPNQLNALLAARVVTLVWDQRP
jgi:hypothetical protein